MFPPVELADEDGLLCWGGELSTRTLVEAYRSGIFPWPHDGLPLLWFAPPQRGILFCDELKISRRARRALRSENFEFKINADFAGVMQACTQPREYSEGTWINDEIRRAYEKLHDLKIAHSVETYRDGKLVGGLYGVSWGAYFCGESMFHVESHASKAALVFLIEHLQSKGAGWLDCQLLTPFFESLGAREVGRNAFGKMRSAAWNAPPVFNC